MILIKMIINLKKINIHSIHHDEVWRDLLRPLRFFLDIYFLNLSEAVRLLVMIRFSLTDIAS